MQNIKLFFGYKGAVAFLSIACAIILYLHFIEKTEPNSGLLSIYDILFATFILPLLLLHSQYKDNKENRKKIRQSLRLSKIIVEKLKKNNFVRIQDLPQNGESILEELSSIGLLRPIFKPGEQRPTYIWNEAQLHYSPAVYRKNISSVPSFIAAKISFGILYFLLLIKLDLTSKGLSHYLQIFLSNLPIKQSGLIFIVASMGIIALDLIHSLRQKRNADKSRMQRMNYLSKRNKGRVNIVATSQILGIPLTTARSFISFLQEKGVAALEYDKQGRSYFQIKG